MAYPKINGIARNFTLRFAVHYAGPESRTRGIVEFAQFVREHAETSPGLQRIRCGDFDQDAPLMQQVEAFRPRPEQAYVPRFLVETYVFEERSVDEQFEETRAALAAGGWEVSFY